jgi:DnaJ family protein C protein 28
LDGWGTIAENLIREAMEKGAFDDLPGKGKPLDLSRDPFEDPLAPTFRRILRDNGATHPLLEARRALEEEIRAAREDLRRAWRARQIGGSQKAWEHGLTVFRKNAVELNRSIKLNNLRSSIPSFQLLILDVDEEISKIDKYHE